MNRNQRQNHADQGQMTGGQGRPPQGQQGQYRMDDTNRDAYRGFDQHPPRFDSQQGYDPTNQPGGVNYPQHDRPGPGDIPGMQAGQGPNQYGQGGGPNEHRSQGWENASDREFRQGYRFQDNEAPPRSQPYPHSTGWQQQYREGYGQQQPFGSNAQEPYAQQHDVMRGGHTHHGMQNRQSAYSQPGNDGRSEIRNFGPGQTQAGYGADTHLGGIVYGSPGRAPNRSEYSQTGAGNRHNNGPKNYKRSDDRIMEDICETICQVQGLDCSDVEIEVKDCNVTIKGQVGERWMKHQVEDIADEVRGVKGIENQIRVQRDRDSQNQERENEASNRAGGNAGSSSKKEKATTNASK